MNNVFIGIILYIGSCLEVRSSQIFESSDTVRLYKKDVTQFYDSINFLVNKGVYYINYNIVTKNEYLNYKRKSDSIVNIINNNLGNYFIFLNDSNVKIEEGKWSIEFFTGEYKSYYSNGKLKERGSYTKESDKLYLPGQKIGKWKYYDTNGKIKKIVENIPKEVRKGNPWEPPIIPEK